MVRAPGGKTKLSAISSMVNWCLHAEHDRNSSSHQLTCQATFGWESYRKPCQGVIAFSKALTRSTVPSPFFESDGGFFEFGFLKVQIALECLRSDYIIAPADKASHNYFFIRKRCYLLSIFDELNRQISAIIYTQWGFLFSKVPETLQCVDTMELYFSKS